MTSGLEKLVIEYSGMLPVIILSAFPAHMEAGSMLDSGQRRESDMDPALGDRAKQLAYGLAS